VYTREKYTGYGYINLLIRQRGVLKRGENRDWNLFFILKVLLVATLTITK